MQAWQHPHRLSSLLALLVAASAAIVFVQPATAQTSSTTAAIVGTVSDNTKAVVPGVTITLTGPALMGARTVVTEPNGAYRFPNLPPGENYKLVFELPGFTTVTREGVVIGLGFTATINVELTLSGMTETLTVAGASPVVDVTATKVTTSLTSQLANVMGSRDYTMLLSSVPGISLARMDVGGSNAINNIGYTAYGLTYSRGEIEGIMTNEGNTGGTDMNYTNMNSMEEVAVTPVGNGADMPKPGNLSSVISKSGGNAYHGTVYQDYESKGMESRNIDDALIARGVAGVGKVGTRDVNRIDNTNDFSADLGGFIMKDKIWWYGAYRHQHQSQNYGVLVDATAHINLPIRSLKGTYLLNNNNKISGYYTRGTKLHDNYSIPSMLINSNSLTNEVYPTGTYSITYDSVLSQHAVLVLRTGTWYDRSFYIGKCDQIPDGRGDVGYGGECQLRYTDNAANMLNGTAQTTLRAMDRPQVNGSLTYFKDGWIGGHNFKFGGEFMHDAQHESLINFQNIQLFVNNGVPSQARIYYPPTTAHTRLNTTSLYAQDSWRFNSRFTVNYGFRLDRYRSYYPDQVGINEHKFDEYTGMVWNNPGPRIGVVLALTGDQRTIVKANWGTYWSTPGPALSGTFNPNASANYSTYEWVDPNPVYAARPAPTADPRGLPVFDPSKLGRLVSTTGTRSDFSPATTLDPDLQNTYVNQFASYLEREVASNFGVRLGFVWNATRQNRETVNINQPEEAFNVPVTVANPGPDGRVGTADDGASIQAWNLDAAHLPLPPVNVVVNEASLDSDYYTWEITANRRQTGRWSMLASFAKTWTQAGVSDANPNELINTTDGENLTNTWNAKLSGTFDAGLGIRLLPSLRHQSGTNFAPTFQARLNYSSNVSIKAAPAGSMRNDNITLFDLRAEKNFSVRTGLIGTTRITAFIDLYNLFNNNGVQAQTTSYGATWLRPTVITGPRIVRLGARFSF